MWPTEDDELHLAVDSKDEVMHVGKEKTFRA